MKSRTVVIGARITKSFARIIEHYLESDTHVNSSDLIRDAVREKILRDAPHLLKELFKEDKTNNSTQS